MRVKERARINNTCHCTFLHQVQRPDHSQQMTSLAAVTIWSKHGSLKLELQLLATLTDSMLGSETRSKSAHQQHTYTCNHDCRLKQDDVLIVNLTYGRMKLLVHWH